MNARATARGSSPRASRAQSALLVVSAAALVGGCALPVGRIYYPGTIRAAEDPSLRVEVRRVVVVERRGETATWLDARITSAEALAIRSAHLTSAASPPCDGGVTPVRSSRAVTEGSGLWAHVRWAELVGDLPVGTSSAGIAFVGPPSLVGPSGPENLDVGFDRAGGAGCLRVSLAPTEQGWAERGGLYLGAGTGARWVRADRRGWVPVWNPLVLSTAMTVGPLRARFDGAFGPSSLVAGVSAEALLAQRGRLGVVGSVGYEQETLDRGGGGPRLGVHVRRLAPRTSWSGYRDRPAGMGYGLDVYASRWFSYSGSTDTSATWVFWVGLSGDVGPAQERR